MPPWLIISVKPVSNSHSGYSGAQCLRWPPLICAHGLVLFFSSTSGWQWKRKNMVVCFFFHAYISLCTLSVEHYLLVRASVSLFCANWIEMYPLSVQSSEIKTPRPTHIPPLQKKKKKANVTGFAGPGSSRHNGHREPTRINAQLRSCRHGRSLSIRMRMCRWGFAAM